MCVVDKKTSQARLQFTPVSLQSKQPAPAYPCLKIWLRNADPRRPMTKLAPCPRSKLPALALGNSVHASYKCAHACVRETHVLVSVLLLLHLLLLTSTSTTTTTTTATTTTTTTCITRALRTHV
jgi:hypothetical protein